METMNGSVALAKAIDHLTYADESEDTEKARTSALVGIGYALLYLAGEVTLARLGH